MAVVIPEVLLRDIVVGDVIFAKNIPKATMRSIVHTYFCTSKRRRLAACPYTGQSVGSGGEE